MTQLRQPPGLSLQSVGSTALRLPAPKPRTLSPSSPNPSRAPSTSPASSSRSSASRSTPESPGYVEKVLVDRGSVVKQGQLLAELSAPELAAKIAEAESSVHAAESDRLQAEAQLAAAQSTWDRLKKAAETPGAIAGNELTQAEKQVEAARALVSARQQASRRRRGRRARAESDWRTTCKSPRPSTA